MFIENTITSENPLQYHRNKRVSISYTSNDELENAPRRRVFQSRINVFQVSPWSQKKTRVDNRQCHTSTINLVQLSAVYDKEQLSGLGETNEDDVARDFTLNTSLNNNASKNLKLNDGCMENPSNRTDKKEQAVTTIMHKALCTL